jgi:hypothetical protein
MTRLAFTAPEYRADGSIHPADFAFSGSPRSISCRPSPGSPTRS